MRDPDRIPQILEAVEEVWRKAPDLRLAQLIVNACQPVETTGQIYKTEDERLLEGLRRVKDKLG